MVDHQVLACLGQEVDLQGTQLEAGRQDSLGVGHLGTPLGDPRGGLVEELPGGLEEVRTLDQVVGTLGTLVVAAHSQVADGPQDQEEDHQGSRVVVRSLEVEALLDSLAADRNSEEALLDILAVARRQAPAGVLQDSLEVVRNWVDDRLVQVEGLQGSQLVVHSLEGPHNRVVVHNQGLHVAVERHAVERRVERHAMEHHVVDDPPEEGRRDDDHAPEEGHSRQALARREVDIHQGLVVGRHLGDRGAEAHHEAPVGSRGRGSDLSDQDRVEDLEMNDSSICCGERLCPFAFPEGAGDCAVAPWSVTALGNCLPSVHHLQQAGKTQVRGGRR